MMCTHLTEPTKQQLTIKLEPPNWAATLDRNFRQEIFRPSGSTIAPVVIVGGGRVVVVAAADSGAAAAPPSSFLSCNFAERRKGFRYEFSEKARRSFLPLLLLVLVDFSASFSSSAWLVA